MNSSNPNKPATESPVNSASEAIVIPVVREEAQIDMLQEHLGTVRVRKVVHQVDEPVRAAGYREVVETTRVPVNQLAQAVKPPWHDGDVLVIPVYEERLVKQLVLLEEIRVTRKRESFEDSVTASLRREEVIVERLNPDTRQWVPDAP
jgi:stress response protein YsnF